MGLALISCRAEDTTVPAPSGAPALCLRLVLAGKVIGYTSDTAWTGSLTEVAAEADLLIAEAYYRDKPVPYHLRLTDLQAHRGELASRRIILTHLSADMLTAPGQHGYEIASDGLSPARVAADARLEETGMLRRTIGAGPTGSRSSPLC
jgi:ribonuclease BN (tRNA processing enzyme)